MKPGRKTQASAFSSVFLSRVAAISTSAAQITCLPVDSFWPQSSAASLLAQPEELACHYDSYSDITTCYYEYSSAQSIGRGMLIASVITSPISGALAASSQNKKLRKELHITLVPNPKEPMLAVAYRF